MTEELKSQADYFKDEPIYLRKVIEELEQENKDFEVLAKSLYKRIEELEKENEALAFRERLYKADYEASEQEKKQMKSALEEINILAKNYCNACDEFKAKTYKNKNDCLYCNYGFIKRKINEVLPQTKDIGFWDSEGNYKEDIQEIDKEELK
jgi:regulator of replication initiation timing